MRIKLSWAGVGLAAVWCMYACQSPFAVGLAYRDLSDPSTWVRMGLLALPALALMIAAMGKFSERRLAFAGFLTTAILLLVPAENARLFRDPDECFHLRFVWELAQGHLPYRDFFCVYHLGYHALFVPIMKLLPLDLELWVVGVKYATLLTCLGSLAIMAEVVRMMGGRRLIFWPLALSFAPMMAATTEFRGDAGSWLCIAAATYWLLKERCGLAGLACALAFVCSQKALIYTFVLAVAMLGQGYPWREFCHKAIRFSAGFAGLCIPFLAVIVALGLWNDYLNYAFYFPAIIARWAQASSFFHSNATLYLRLAIGQNPMLFLLALWQVIGSARSKGPSQVVALACGLSLLFVLSSHIAYKQYTFQSYLWLAALAAAALGQSNRQGTMIATCLATFYLAGWWAERLPGIDLTLARQALQQSAPGESYYGENHLGGYSDPIFRPSAVYYSFAQAFYARGCREMNFQPPYGDPGDLRPLLQFPPKIMIFDSPSRQEEARGMLQDAGINYLLDGQLLIRSAGSNSR